MVGALAGGDRVPVISTPSLVVIIINVLHIAVKTSLFSVSESAFFLPSFLRLFQLAFFLKCRRTLLELNY